MTDTANTFVPFLKAVAQEVLATYGADLHDVCIVLPGKRACRFLSNYISETVEDQYRRTQSGREEARLVTMLEFQELVTGMTTGSHIELLFTLYNSWRRIAGNADFDSFRSWGETALKDFDEIDMHDVEANGIFSNISSHDEIATSYLNDEQYSVVEEFFGVKLSRDNSRFWQHIHTEREIDGRFAELWERLPKLYEVFRRELHKQKIAYPGMLSREAADMFEAKGTGCLPGRHIIFAGLDDLPASQLRLMKALKGLMAPDSKPVADFFWDAPGTPLSPESDIDAGAQFQILKEKFPCSHPGFDNYVKNCTFPPRLEVIACPGNSVQTKVAGRLLEQIAAEEEGQVSADMARVAVVLPDEGLLFPMYSAVPEAVAKNVNVTMGYPIRSTSASSFVSHLRKLQMLNRRIKVRTLFHNEEVRLLLAHPFVQQILGVQTVEKIQGYLLTNRLFYLDAEDMLEALGGEEKQKAGEQLKILFTPLERGASGTALLTWLRECLLLAMRRLAAGSGLKEWRRIDLLPVQTYLGVISEFERLCNRYMPGDMDWKTAFSMLDRMLYNYTVKLQGEPLTGLQIMGMLETRALDFDYLVIPSMNERIFPRRLRVHTFIPDSIRHGWGLPATARKEQHTAYLFYRLIARAKQVYMLYNATQSGLKSGDPSRYLLQLKHLFNGGSGVKWRTAGFKIDTPVKPQLTVPKDLDELQPYLTRGSGKNLSASSLKEYLTCPLKFYLGYVLGKKLIDEPQEFMDAATQGTVLHNTMQALYESLIPAGQLAQIKKGKAMPPEREITKEILQGWLDDPDLIRNTVERVIREVYPPAKNMNPLLGDVQINAEITERYVRWVLEADKRLAPFTYLDNEHKITVQYPLSSGRKVNMTFIIDRLDKVRDNEGNERIRIVDYKTGSDERETKTVNSLFNLNGSNNVKGIFQLFLYSLLYPLADSKKAGEPLALSLYPTRRLEADDFKTMVEMGKSEVFDHTPYLPDFKSNLDAKLEELFNPEIPYRQTDANVCSFCEFKLLCGR